MHNLGTLDYTVSYLHSLEITLFLVWSQFIHVPFRQVFCQETLLVPTLCTGDQSQLFSSGPGRHSSKLMSLMIIKHALLKTIRGSIPEEENAQKYLAQVTDHFAKNEKAEASTILGNLVSMRYKSKVNIREYIMEMSNLTAKLKSLKQELFEDILVHLVIISPLAQFNQFKVSYNT